MRIASCRFCFVLVCSLLVCASAHAIALTRGPYLGRPDDHSVAIIWRTDTPADSRVEYVALIGGARSKSVAESELVINHVIRIDDVEPGTWYRYTISSAGTELGQGQYRAPRGVADADFTFAVIGDTNARVVPELIARKLVDAAPDFAIHTGDVVYPDGSDELYDDEFFKPLAAFVRQAAVLPTIGNHDAVTRHAEPLLRNFVTPGAGRPYYSFREGRVLFVCIDVQTTPFGKGSPQYEWIITTLRNSDAKWKIVYLHDPPYSSDHSSIIGRMILGPIFERYGADIVFSGSAHLYERTVPLCDFGAASCRGVVYVTEGGGGAGLSGFRARPFTAFVMARHGFTLVDVEATRLSVSSRDVDGTVVDSFVIEK